ncbi:MAG: M56 family metallopeptidase [Defluviitaleaceae bacterium]|nr:M56 family metallopeptidase [Defluviitaleaceae bacterium]
MSFVETYLFMSLTGSVMIVAIMFIRPLLKRWKTFGILQLLWIAACVMLLTPLRIPSPINIYNVFVGFHLYGAPSQANLQGSTLLPAYVLTTWQTGVLVALIYAAVSALFLHRRFKDAIPRADLNALIGKKNRVFISSHTSGPLTYGVFRPRIILPMSISGMDEDALEFMLLHELQHIRSKDALINVLWIFALCLHWFNPFVWLGWVYLRRDMEAKCDAKVLKHIGAECRAGYAQALLNMVPVKQMVLPLSFGSSSAACRIKGILSYHPAKRRNVIASFAVMLCCLILFTSAPTISMTAESVMVTRVISVSTYPGDFVIHFSSAEHAHTSTYIRIGTFFSSIEGEIDYEN